MGNIIWNTGYFILFLVWISIRGYFGKKAVAQKTKEKIRPGIESGLVALNFIGMMFLPLLAVFTPFLDPYAFTVPDPVRFVLLIITAFNIWLFAKVHRDLGKNWSAILEIKEGHHLVQSGIYEKIRHPMYAHLWIWVIAQGIILANGLVLVYGIAAWGLLYFIRVPKEEDMLTVEFGDEYRDYMKNTGRIVPKFW
jgi:protein-S-isoprenylcysteine O-methyltransferase Ste14